MPLAGPAQGQVCYALAKKLTFPFLSQKALLILCISNRARVRRKEASQKCSPLSSRKLTWSWLRETLVECETWGMRLLSSVVQRTYKLRQ